MNGTTRVTLRRGAAAAIGVALVLAGAGAAYLLMRATTGQGGHVGILPASGVTDTPTAAVQPSATAPAPNDGPLPDVVVSLTTEAVQRAGIVVAPVAIGTSAGDLRLPGVVEPNAYRQVAVTPWVAGRVTEVSADLGVHVRRGQTLARIYSPALSEAQTTYVSARAMLDAHDRELARTERLVEIGAASRQELERIHAEHAAQTAAVQSAHSQLELLGVPASTIQALASGGSVEATTVVPAPIDGVITERAANVGLNVDPATTLFTVVDLSTVWIVADVHERDLARVRVGSDATITTAAAPGLPLRGRVSYIDPRMTAETRTARVRVEVPNPRGELRLGMYADVVVTGVRGVAVSMVPQSAVQHVGDRTVVYLADPTQPGRFTEREVRLRPSSGNSAEIESGVEPGDVVVTEGSFFLRAERERMGLRPAAATVGTLGGENAQAATVLVTEQGFEPATVALRAGTPARLTFLRTTDATCGTEIVVPSLNIRRALPLNEPVPIAFTPAQTGEIAFACGMNMLKGAMVVQ